MQAEEAAGGPPTPGELPMAALAAKVALLEESVRAQGADLQEARWVRKGHKEQPTLRQLSARRRRCGIAARRTQV